MQDLITCNGCGGLVRNLSGKAHAYIGASAGCWEIYGQILAKEYGEYDYPELTHMLSLDTYAVQHPGLAGRQAIQSVNVHLARLYLLLEAGTSAGTAAQALSQILKKKKDQFIWLEPPIPNGHITVCDVARAEDLANHQKLVRAWAQDVWQAWSIHRNHILSLVKSL